LNGKINFLDIPRMIEEVLEKHDTIENLKLDDINYLMDWTKQYMRENIYGY